MASWVQGGPSALGCGAPATVPSAHISQRETRRAQLLTVPNEERESSVTSFRGGCLEQPEQLPTQGQMPSQSCKLGSRLQGLLCSTRHTAHSDFSPPSVAGARTRHCLGQRMKGLGGLLPSLLVSRLTQGLKNRCNVS